jgi:hypothetical protein
VGYTEWNKAESGLLVYRANPALIKQDDHSQGDCGNDPTYAKWAYYLFADNEKANPDSYCITNQDGFEVALVREGESVSYGGVKITLETSVREADIVSVVSAPNSRTQRVSKAAVVIESFGREPETNNFCGCCGCFPGANLH